MHSMIAVTYNIGYSLYFTVDVLLLLFYFFFFLPYSEACGILVYRPGIEPIPLTLEVQNLKHCTTMKAPTLPLIFIYFAS